MFILSASEKLDAEITIGPLDLEQYTKPKYRRMLEVSTLPPTPPRMEASTHISSLKMQTPLFTHVYGYWSHSSGSTGMLLELLVQYGTFLYSLPKHLSHIYGCFSFFFFARNLTLVTLNGKN